MLTPNKLPNSLAKVGSSLKVSSPSAFQSKMCRSLRLKRFKWVSTRVKCHSFFLFFEIHGSIVNARFLPNRDIDVSPETLRRQGRHVQGEAVEISFPCLGHRPRSSDGSQATKLVISGIRFDPVWKRFIPDREDLRSRLLLSPFGYRKA